MNIDTKLLLITVLVLTFLSGAAVGIASDKRSEVNLEFFVRLALLVVGDVLVLVRFLAQIEIPK